MRGTLFKTSKFDLKVFLILYIFVLIEKSEIQREKSEIQCEKSQIKLERGKAIIRKILYCICKISTKTFKFYFNRSLRNDVQTKP